MKKKFKLAVTWEMCGVVEVEGENLEDAMNNFNEKVDEIELPVEFQQYVDSSFRLSSDDVEEMEAMI